MTPRPGRVPRSLGGRGPRATAGLLAAVLAALTAGCQPPPDRYHFRNDSGVELYVWGDDVLPPGRETTVLVDRGGCFEGVELVSEDRSLAAVLDHPICDRDTVVITDADLVDATGTATVLNATGTALEVTFDTEHGPRRQSLAPGGSMPLELLRPAGSCRPEVLHAVAPLPYPAVEVPVIHPGPVCDGDVWRVDEETLAAGSAVVAVTNATDYGLEVTMEHPDWWVNVTRELAPGAVVELPVGAPPDGCGEGSIVAATPYGDEQGTVRAELPGPLCAGAWVITAQDVLVRDDATGDDGPLPGSTPAPTSSVPPSQLEHMGD